jgi:glucose-1-phosphate cytidylyltransferase
MIEIGGKPILWHIMKLYSFYGIHDFIICCGYKGYLIKEYFSNYFLHMSDVTFDLIHNEMRVHDQKAEPWRVTLVDTGENTMTGGRLKRVAKYLPANEMFCLTYGDGLSDVNITELIEYHNTHGCLATLVAVTPPGRFGLLTLDESKCVKAFREKPEGNGEFINGGFFVLSPRVIDLIEGDQTIWERGPLETLAQTEQLKAYRHDGFWQPMDTLRDKNLLEELWVSGKAPWKVWE